MTKSYRKYLAGTVATAVVASALPVAGVSAASFKDEVPSWAKESVDYLVAKGAINGLPNGTFAAQQEITRGEAAKIIAISLGLTIDENAKASFDDAKDHWASKYIAALEKQKPGVISGTPDGSFKPNSNITRQELAKIIVTAYDLKVNEDAGVQFSDNNSWGKEYVNVLAQLGVVQGVGGDRFNPNGTVTRGEVPVFVHRAEVKEKRVVKSC